MQSLPICHGEIICCIASADVHNFLSPTYRPIFADFNLAPILLHRGVMTGHKNVSDLQSMYEVFLRTAWYILKDKARIVMLVLRGLQLTRIIRKLSGRYR